MRSVSESVEQVNADEMQFSRRLAREFQAAIRGNRVEPHRVVFDISVGANRLLLRCLNVLFELEISLQILYSEADVYYPTKEEYEVDPQQWTLPEKLGLEARSRYRDSEPLVPGPAS